ncbi:MAG: hypothetical protein MJ180_00280 [Candidatus Gastranaerophilales bacterium]|nr:hypothetical protein [Candidatus Gastranaerophilales bacterium]
MEEQNRRWYDDNEDMLLILDTLENQPDELIDNLAENIMTFSNIIRQNIEEMSIEEPVSIGKERMLGYYKSFQRRRWYDKNWTLLSIVNVLSTLPEDDFQKIIQGVKDILKEMDLL